MFIRQLEFLEQEIRFWRERVSAAQQAAISVRLDDPHPGSTSVQSLSHNPEVPELLATTGPVNRNSDDELFSTFCNMDAFDEGYRPDAPASSIYSPEVTDPVNRNPDEGHRPDTPASSGYNPEVTDPVNGDPDEELFPMFCNMDAFDEGHRPDAAAGLNTSEGQETGSSASNVIKCRDSIDFYSSVSSTPQESTEVHRSIFCKSSRFYENVQQSSTSPCCRPGIDTTLGKTSQFRSYPRFRNNPKPGAIGFRDCKPGSGKSYTTTITSERVKLQEANCRGSQRKRFAVYCSSR